MDVPTRIYSLRAGAELDGSDAFGAAFTYDK